MAAAFAVVAAEVRNLAGKSAEAAKEIEGLINESVNRVDVGNEFMEHSVKTLQQIVETPKNIGGDHGSSQLHETNHGLARDPNFH